MDGASAVCLSSQTHWFPFAHPSQQYIVPPLVSPRPLFVRHSLLERLHVGHFCSGDSRTYWDIGGLHSIYVRAGQGNPSRLERVIDALLFHLPSSLDSLLQSSCDIYASRRAHRACVSLRLWLLDCPRHYP